jgi:hypothetical protein
MSTLKRRKPATKPSNNKESNETLKKSNNTNQYNDGVPSNFMFLKLLPTKPNV